MKALEIGERPRSHTTRDSGAPQDLQLARLMRGTLQSATASAPEPRTASIETADTRTPCAPVPYQGPRPAAIPTAAEPGPNPDRGRSLHAERSLRIGRLTS